jgi:alpha-L-fucosidase 2
MNFWARLHDGNHVYILLEKLLEESTFLNLWSSNPSFQIDVFIFFLNCCVKLILNFILYCFILLGNFGTANGIVEMLIQSQGDELIQVNLYFILF